MFSSREQDISREQQSRDLISETIESGAESMTQLNDMYFIWSARRVLREETVDSKLNTQSMKSKRRGDETLDQITGYC